MAKYWIQKAKIKKGSLSRSLQIPITENIPMELLNKIVNAETGEIIRNPTNSGKKLIRITTKIQRQASLARNLKRL